MCIILCAPFILLPSITLVFSFLFVVLELSFYGLMDVNWWTEEVRWMKQENNSILLYDHIFHSQQKNELKGSLLVFDNREMLLVALRLNYIK